MTWTHGTGASAGGTSAVPSLSRPAGITAGQLIWAVITSVNPILNGPPGWICDGRAQDDSAEFSSWWHKVAGAEPASYAWACASGSWTILLDSFNSTVALDNNNVVDEYAMVKASATATTLAGARPIESFAGDLILRWASSQGAVSTTWGASMTNLQNNNGLGSAWEVQAANGQAAARTVTFGATEPFRIEVCAAYAALAPASAVVHTVTGSGSFTITGPVAVDIALTGIPSSIGTGKGNPTRYFDIGNVAWGTSLGYGRNHYLEHAQELILAPFPTCTLLAYSLRSGVTAVITERLSV